MKNQPKLCERIPCDRSGADPLTLPNLKKFWKKSKPKIEKRLKEFRTNWLMGSEERLFAELAFCLFTPQSKAVSCGEAVKRLSEKGLLLHGRPREIAEKINIVRFRNNKARYLVEARDKVSRRGALGIKAILSGMDSILERREWLVGNIKGLGYKEASHFLRNVGFGSEIAILDRHILRNLSRLGVITKIPESISEKSYLDIEKKMKSFSKKVRIPLDHLDLLFWCRETGEIYK